MTNGATVMSLTASLLQKISAATDCLCQICYSENYHINSKSAVNFQVALK